MALYSSIHLLKCTPQGHQLSSPEHCLNHSRTGSFNCDFKYIFRFGVFVSLTLSSFARGSYLQAFLSSGVHYSFSCLITPHHIEANNSETQRQLQATSVCLVQFGMRVCEGTFAQARRRAASVPACLCTSILPENAVSLLNLSLGKETLR